MGGREMGFLSYIIPQETILKLIILVMFVLAAFVARKCYVLYLLGKENLNMLNQMEDVSDLEKALLSNDVDLNEAFSNYEEKLGKTNSTFVLFEHLKAIYDAGIKSSRLDADLLVKNTVDKIFTGVDSIKTSISLFLVIGILGTLAGLAISIGGFSGANFVMTGQSGSTADQLSLLFGNLRGAFAPSMWGVFFTITYVFGYSWFVQEKCINKVTEKLTINTIRSWLPRLYPTDFQRGEQNLRKLKATIENADGINNGVRDLEKSLNSSNKTLRQLSKVSETIQKASDKFDQSTDKILRIKELYEELKKANEAFNQSIHQLVDTAVQERKDSYQEYSKAVAQSLDNVKISNEQMQGQMSQYFTALSETLQQQNSNVAEGMKQQNMAFSENMHNQIQTWKATLENQNLKLKEVIDQLKIYSTTYSQNVEATEASLNKSIEVNRNAAIANQNLAEKLREIEEKLLNRQDDLMKEISQPITDRIGDVASKLLTIQSPLDHSVKLIQKMTDGHAKIIGNSVSQVQELVDTMKERQDIFEEKNQEVTKTILKLQQTMDNLNLNLSVIMASNAKKGDEGLSPDILKNFIETQVQSSSEKTYRKSSQQRNNSVDEYEGKRKVVNGFLSVKNIPVFVIAILLLISVVTQVVMVTKISTLEKTQSAVNQVLLKGEMNDSSFGSEK